jgi:hypothetical protein
MGVLAGASVAGQLTRVVSYDCRVKLPTFTDLLTMPVRVAHLQPHNNGTSYLGLSLDDERGDTKPFADELCRFSAWYQRRLIAQIRQRH